MAMAPLQPYHLSQSERFEDGDGLETASGRLQTWGGLKREGMKNSDPPLAYGCAVKINRAKRLIL